MYETLIKRIARSFASGLIRYSYVCHSRGLLSGNPVSFHKELDSG